MIEASTPSGDSKKLAFDRGGFFGGGLALSLLAGGLFFYSVLVIVKSWGLGSWHRTQAVVLESRRTTANVSDKPRVRFDFEYTYDVDGKRYTATRYSFATAGGSQSEAVERFQDGQLIEIYYDPNDPSSAVVLLERAGISVFLLAALALLFGYIAYGMSFAPRSSVLARKRMDEDPDFRRRVRQRIKELKTRNKA